jgi:hypothetical protein
MLQYLFHFPEMVEDMLVPLVALGVEYYSGPVVTILASKTSRKSTERN